MDATGLDELDVTLRVDASAALLDELGEDDVGVAVAGRLLGLDFQLLLEVVGLLKELLMQNLLELSG